MAVDTGAVPEILACGLLARPLQQRDAESLRLLRNQDQVRAWFRHSDRIGREAQEEWVGRQLARRDDYMWVAVDVKGSVVAAVGVYDFDWDPRVAEVGRVMSDQHNRSYGGSGRQLLIYAFGAAFRLGMRGLYLYVKDRNERAFAIYRGLGFIESPRRNEAGMRYLELDLSKEWAGGFERY